MSLALNTDYVGSQWEAVTEGAEDGSDGLPQRLEAGTRCLHSRDG